MAAAAAATQAFCHVCYGTSLTFENGVLVCDACGTQTQTYQEEAEYQQGIDDTRGRRRAAGSSASAAQSQAAMLVRAEQQAAQQLAEAAFAYVCCLQQLLRAQATELSSRYGVSTQLDGIVRQLWLAHLPTTGILESRPRQPAAAAAQARLLRKQQKKKQKQPRGNNAAAAADPAINAGSGVAAGQQRKLPGGAHKAAAELVKPHNMRRLFWKMVYLGCVVLREAVTLDDLLSWALDGQLPYLDAPHVISKVMPEDDLMCLPLRCIQPQLGTSPIAFFTSCCRLADSLVLKLPPVAAEPLLLRAVTEMALPQVVYDTAVQLHFMHTINSPRLRMAPVTKRNQVTPYAWLTALLLVTVKLLYGLGNAVGQVPLVAKAAAPPEGWQAWSQALLSRAPGITNVPLTEQEVLSLGPDALQQYLTYCRSHMFAGQQCVPSFEDIQRLLMGWFDAATNARREAAERQQQQRQQQQQQQRRAAAAAAAAVGSQPPSVAGLSTAGAGAAGLAGHSQGAAAAPATQPQPPLQPLGASGGGTALPNNPSAALPPGIATYNLGMSSKAAAWFRLEPDLAAVVVAVAAYSRVSTDALLECMRMLEKQMVAVEAGVKVLHGMQAAANQQRSATKKAAAAAGGGRCRPAAAAAAAASAYAGGGGGRQQ